MRTLNEILLNNGDASGDLISSVLDLEQLLGFAITAVFTGAVTGSIKLQSSTDAGTSGPSQGTQGLNVINWNDIADSSVAVTGAGDITWNYDGAYYKWVRVVFTHTANSGNLTVIANAKGF